MLRSVARLSLAGVLRVHGQKDDTADEGWEEHQTSCPDDGPTENQRETAQNSRDDRRTEKQCPLAHDASLSGAAGAVILNDICFQQQARATPATALQSAPDSCSAGPAIKC
jgi:hypothetical protein